MKQLFLVLAVLILLAGCGSVAEYGDMYEEDLEEETEEVQEEEIDEDFFADEDEELEVEPVI